MSILTYFKKHAVISVVIAIIAVIAMIIAGRMATGKKAATSAESNIKQVALVEARSFRTDISTVSADGIVESFSQADLKSQTSAPVSTVRVSVGDNVYSGQVLVELQNADIRAQLEQAKANLALVQGQNNTGDISLESARRSAIDKIREGYQKADDAVFTQVEQFLYGSPGVSAPRLSSFSADSRLQDKISLQYTDIKESLRLLNISSGKLSDKSTSQEIMAELASTRKNLDKVSLFLADISQSLNGAAMITSGPDAVLIGTWKGITTSARGSINSAISNITAAETSLSGSVSSQGTPATAQISVAQAGVKNLEAQLAKTIIRSPIAGKVAELPLRAGELASQGQLVATVVGGGGLVVKAYVSGEDFSKIKKGAAVSIRGNVKGVVDAIAPSVSQTNKKVEVRIVVSDPQTSGLVVGESVQTLIVTERAATQVAEGALYLLPIQNVKIVPGDAYVFTVDENSKVQKRQIILGEVKGDFVEVKSGLSDDMRIVSPVYELNEGETVKTQ